VDGSLRGVPDRIERARRSIAVLRRLVEDNRPLTAGGVETLIELLAGSRVICRLR